MGLLFERIWGLVTYTLSTILLSYFVITTFFAICCKKVSSKASKTRTKWIFTCCSCACIILFWLRSFLVIIYLCIITASPQNIDKYESLPTVGWLFYGSGIWTMLLVFVLRIDYTLSGQYNLEYSPIMIKILYCMLAVLLILIFVTGIIGDVNIYKYLAFITLIFHFIFSCLLSYLLFNKIFIMMKSRLNEQMQANVDVDVDSQQKGDVITLNGIKSVTRFALLMFIGILSTYILSVLVLLDVTLSWSSHQNIEMLATIFIGMDMMVNGTSVYLLFQFNNNKYFAVCNIAHRCCQKCCIQCIAKTQKNKTKQECENLIFGQDTDNDALL